MSEILNLVLFADGAHIKKGTSIVAGCLFMQRDADYFPDPDQFRPERFLEENRHPYMFVPFSAGELFSN